MPRKGGPNTPEGRERVSQNAIRHGILSNKPVIAGLETVEERDQFDREIIESWAPVGGYELELTAGIAHDLWRLRRCRIYESAVLCRQMAEAEAELLELDDDFDDDVDDGFDDDLDDGSDDGEAGAEDAAPDDARPAGDAPEAVAEVVDPALLRAHQQLRVIPDEWSLERLLRYETHVRRSLNQTVHELEAAQARRQGQPAAVTRVDFTASPSLKRPASDEASFLRRVNRDMAYAELGLGQRKRARREKKK